LVVAGYLGTLGLMANTRRGWHSVLRPAVALRKSSLARGASSSPVRLGSRTVSALHHVSASISGSRHHPSYASPRRAGPAQRASGHSSAFARGGVLRPWARGVARVGMAKVRSPTLRWRRRALRPNHAVNPDAPSAWLLLAGECSHHRIVARHAGAPVTLVR
jgi:hypothetical protein